MPDRPLREIAREIHLDWGNKVNYAARPYLDAMLQLETIDENFCQDSGRSVVGYFLSDATTYRGETARRVKKELNDMLKGKQR